MFRREGYQVYRFGYEPVLRNLVQEKLKIEKEDKVEQFVATMPDFLVSRNNKLHFIEVKYRKDGKLSRKELKSWAQGRILLVFPFPPYFKISRVEEFLKTGKLYDLENDKFIPIKKSTINVFEPLIAKYLAEK